MSGKTIRHLPGSAWVTTSITTGGLKGDLIFQSAREHARRHAAWRFAELPGRCGNPPDHPGDSCWRPYLTIGLGQATFRFMDDQCRSIHESLLSMPFGCGLKYFYSPNTTVRFDLVENFAFGSHTIENQANFSLMAAVEFRFGGRKPSDHPWHGNTVGW